MVIDSGNMEFGNELLFTIPRAYWHYKHGNLEATRSGVGSGPFYYFSTIHLINGDKRHWSNRTTDVTVNRFNPTGEWEPPPYKARYWNKEFVYDKPLFVISNKYNMEWGREPVNYINTNTLLGIIEQLSPDYKIFYNRRIPKHIQDDQRQLDLGEHEAIREKHPDVEFIHELPGDYNMNQLMIYANCDRFISVQGGNSILCSYFGGRNIIYAVKGQELVCGLYDRLGVLSGCEVTHVNKYSSIIKEISNG